MSFERLMGEGADRHVIWSLPGGFAGGALQAGFILGLAPFLGDRWPQAIVSTSSGAWNAAYIRWAQEFGQPIEGLADVWSGPPVTELVGRPSPGVYANNNRLLNETLDRYRSLELTQLPGLIIGATRWCGFTINYFERGDVTEILRAAAGFPLVTGMRRIDGVLYCDGAFSDNFGIGEMVRQAVKLSEGQDRVRATLVILDGSIKRNPRALSPSLRMASGLQDKGADLAIYRVVLPHEPRIQAMDFTLGPRRVLCGTRLAQQFAAGHAFNLIETLLPRTAVTVSTVHDHAGPGGPS